MLHSLILGITALLQEHLPGVDIKPWSLAPDTVGPQPMIAIHATQLLVNQVIGTHQDGEPGPQPVRQRLILAAPGGPYALDYPPLPGTVCAQTIPTSGESPTRLLEGQDFIIDDQPTPATLTALFSSRLTPGSALELAYAFRGIARTQALQQELRLEVYATDAAATEHWAALSTAVLLASEDELRTAYNNTLTPQYRAPHFATTYRLEHIQLLAGSTSMSATLSTYQLTFNVTGQMTLIKAIREDSAVIREIQVLSTPA